MIEELQAMVDDGARPDEVLEAVLTRVGLPGRARGSPTDPQDETRVENLGELVAVAREFADEIEDARPSATSSSGSRWSPTPTRSPTRTSPAASSR